MQVSTRRSQSRRTAKTAARRNGQRHAARSRSDSKQKLNKGGDGAARSNRARSEDRAIAKQPDPKTQAAVKIFAEATRHFYRQNFTRAKVLFERVMQSAPSDIAARARVRVSMCEQKLSRSTPAPKTPADYYNLGVGELNARNLDLAVQYLTKADKAAPKRDEIRYALAAAQSLLGNTDSALEHLKAAIALRPENRFLAQHDDDFEPLRSEARFRSLMHPAINSHSHYSS